MEKETDLKATNRKWKERMKFEEANPKRYRKDHLEVFLGVECPDATI